MTLEEAIEVQLKVGKRLDQCVVDDGMLTFCPKYKTEAGRYLGLDDSGRSMDWSGTSIGWQPITPIVKRAQYLIDGLQHRPFISSTLFKDERDVRLFYPGATRVERLTETERDFVE